MSRNHGTPEQLRDERQQRIRAERQEAQHREEALASLQVTHEEEMKRMEEEKRKVEEEKKRVEEAVERRAERERKKEERRQRRAEQEAAQPEIAEQRRLRRLQQPVANDADDAEGGIDGLFGDNSSGAGNQNAPLPARSFEGFTANAFADKRAADAERRQSDDRIRATRKARRRNQAADASLDTMMTGVEALLESPTPPGAASSAPPGVDEVERLDVNDINNLDFDDDNNDNHNDNDSNDSDYTDMSDEEDDNRDNNMMETDEQDGRNEGPPPRGGCSDRPYRPLRGTDCSSICSPADAAADAGAAGRRGVVDVTCDAGRGHADAGAVSCIRGCDARDPVVH